MEPRFNLNLEHLKEAGMLDREMVEDVESLANKPEALLFSQVMLGGMYYGALTLLAEAGVSREAINEAINLSAQVMRENYDTEHDAVRKALSLSEVDAQAIASNMLSNPGTFHIEGESK